MKKETTAKVHAKWPPLKKHSEKPILKNIAIGNSVLFANGGLSKVKGIQWQTSVRCNLWLDDHEKPVGFYINGQHLHSKTSVFDICGVRP